MAFIDKHGKQKTCNLAPNCGCHATVAPTLDAIKRHEDEVSHRIAYCIKNNQVPAWDFVHLAPGDDSNFVYGVPPWHKDGSVNPQGVYTQKETEWEKEMVALMKETQNWTCSSCNRKVYATPRKWVPKNKNEEEPWNWWFCFDCKTKRVKPRKSELQAAKLAKQNLCIKDYFVNNR